MITTKLESPIKSKYFATIEGKTIDLPLTYKTIEQAAQWLNKLPESKEEVRIYERFFYTANGGQMYLRNDDITTQCIDVLWNYYEGN